jgi:hypothetical protein
MADAAPNETGQILRQLIDGGDSVAALRAAFGQARLTPQQQPIADMILALTEAGQQPAEATPANGSTASPDDRIRALEAELAGLRQVNDTVAAALGACPICWGGDPQCEACSGRGRAGFVLPASDLFQKLVAPAVRRVMRARRGCDPAGGEIRR